MMRRRCRSRSKPWFCGTRTAPCSAPGCTNRGSAARLCAWGWTARRRRTPPPPPAPEPAAPAGFGPYECITAAEPLAAWLAAAQAGGLLAVHAAMDGKVLAGLGLASAPGRAIYVPLAHQGDLERQVQQLDLAAARAALDGVLRDPAVLVIFHDAKTDLLALDAAGFAPAAAVDDVMLISYAQSAGAHGQGLDDLSRLHLGHTPKTRDDVTGTGRTRLAFTMLPPDRAAQQAAEAADCALRLWQALRPRLPSNRATALYEQMERRLILVLAAMERAGVMVDATELRRLSADFGERMAVMEADIHRLAGRTFNLGSPKALGEILFDEMKLPGGKRMATGAWGTDASVLNALAEQGARAARADRRMAAIGEAEIDLCR